MPKTGDPPGGDPAPSADSTLGNSVVAIGWSSGEPRAHAPGEPPAGPDPRIRAPPVELLRASHRGQGRAAPPRGGRPPKIVTWLILPVVICLSQRLSHACLSISNYTVKLRMAH